MCSIICHTTVAHLSCSSSTNLILLVAHSELGNSSAKNIDTVKSTTNNMGLVFLKKNNLGLVEV